MDRFFVGTAGAIGAASLVTFILALGPFMAEPTAGAGLNRKTQEIVVNRALKGDRLPMADTAFTKSPAKSSAVQSQDRLRSGRPPKIPVGCDAAFSPISAPTLAYVYQRCMT